MDAFFAGCKLTFTIEYDDYSLKLRMKMTQDGDSY